MRTRSPGSVLREGTSPRNIHASNGDQMNSVRVDKLTGELEHLSDACDNSASVATSYKHTNRWVMAKQIIVMTTKEHVSRWNLHTRERL